MTDFEKSFLKLLTEIRDMLRMDHPDAELHPELEPIEPRFAKPEPDPE